MHCITSISCLRGGMSGSILNGMIAYKEDLPDSVLQEYISCYWIFQKDPPDTQESILPDSYYELIYQPNLSYEAEGKQLPKLFFIGQLNEPLILSTVRSVWQRSIRFYPWGLAPFGNPHAFRKRTVVDAREVLPESVAQRLEEILGMPDDTYQEKLNEYLIQQWLKWQFDDRLVRTAALYLREHHGAVKIHDVVTYCSTSYKQLERGFVRATEHSPKVIASRMRFENVRNTLTHHPETSLATLASDNGYTDQSHLIKEFMRYATISPTDYISQIKKLAPLFADRENVQFLQSKAEHVA